MNKKNILYIVGEFPSYTETFILKEILFLSSCFHIHIISIKKGIYFKDEKKYNPLNNNVIYIPQILSLQIMGNHLLFLCKNERARQIWRKVISKLFVKNLRCTLSKVKNLIISTFISGIVIKNHINHIHAHFANCPTDLALLVSNISGTPFSFSCHAKDIYVNNNNLINKIKNAIFIITCTKYNKNYLDSLVGKKEQDKIYLVYHGVDITYWNFKPIMSERKIKEILFIGRLIEKKGVEYLLESISYLLKQNHLLHLTIVGKGQQEYDLKQFCIKNKIKNSVTFVGWQSPSQIKQLYHNADIFILPSVITSDGDRDGIPNVILEAMASGVPVISTCVSGIPEVIKNDDTGLLITQRNTTQLSEAILSLLHNADYRSTIISKAQFIIGNKFDSNKCSLTLKSIFDRYII